MNKWEITVSKFKKNICINKKKQKTVKKKKRVKNIAL